MLLETERLILRKWRDSDLSEFADINADKRVMEFFPSPLTSAESNLLAGNIQKHFIDNSFGLWAVEVRNIAPFIGFVGLSIPKITAHFTPCVEVGWRLAFKHWGNGYATEGAKAALQYGSDVIKLKEVVSFTASINKKSQAVMRKIGMTHNPKDDFKHPSLADGDALKHHVLYRKASLGI
jgi:RimJ/RimL family protein N-acetyltransferase